VRCSPTLVLPETCCKRPVRGVAIRERQFLNQYPHRLFLTSSPSLEYSSPESIPIPPHYTLPPTDSKSDMWSLGMILHKLIFFRLPYRWAAYGDRPGLDGSDPKSLDEDDERGNDTDRLEREVSSYPGFKSTARLETLFTSRRLPRSYLVLLESLLNVSPTARPTCEKVLAALHLGKVCSLRLIIRRPFRTSS
jgi:serine/threonine protein kinase